MRRIILYFVFMLFSLSIFQCEIVKRSINKDVIHGLSKSLLQKSLKKLLDTDEISFEKDSIRVIDATIKAEKAKKVLGKHISAFLTESGVILLQTKTLKIQLVWKPYQDSLRKIHFEYYRGKVPE